MPLAIWPSTAASTSSGMTMIRSVRRISTESTQPPKYPDTAPTIAPITVESRPTMAAMIMDCWVPRITRAK